MKYVINLFILLHVMQANAVILMRFQKTAGSEARYVEDLLIIKPDLHRWGKIELDSHPKQKEILSRKQMITWLEQKIGTFNYQWQGKNNIKIAPKKLTQADDLITHAKKPLLLYLKHQGLQTIVLKNSNKPQDSDIPIHQFKARFLKKYPPSKRICVLMQSEKLRVPLWFSVKAYQAVWVAKTSVKKNHAASAHDFLLKTVNIAGLNHAPVNQLPKRIWLKKALNKNEILTQVHLGSKPDVLQGQKIKLILKENNVTITVDFIAQEDGYIGQSIKMKNAQNKRLVHATVINKHQAEISV